jgi:hypothetical protein
LVQTLGWLNAVKFLRQYEPGEGDYTSVRSVCLPDWDVETMMTKLSQLPRG